jgi:hypothetical protein
MSLYFRTETNNGETRKEGLAKAASDGASYVHLAVKPRG